MLQLLNNAKDLCIYIIGGIGLIKTIDAMKPIMTDNEYDKMSKAYKILFYPSSSLLESIKEHKKDKEDRKKKIAMEAYEKAETMLNPYPNGTVTSYSKVKQIYPSYDSTVSRPESCIITNEPVTIGPKYDKNALDKWSFILIAHDIYKKKKNKFSSEDSITDPEVLQQLPKLSFNDPYYKMYTDILKRMMVINDIFLIYVHMLNSQI